MKLILQRRMLMNGALTGTLSVEHRNEYGRLSGIEKICDTMERKNGQLPTGEYRVVIGKCSRFARQMIFLEPIKEEDDSSSSSSLPFPKSVSVAVWNASIIGLGAWMSCMPFRAPCFSRATVRSGFAGAVSSSARPMRPASF